MTPAIQQQQDVFSNDRRFLKQVVDGFSYNTMLLWLQERYFPNAQVPQTYDVSFEGIWRLPCS